MGESVEGLLAALGLVAMFVLAVVLLTVVGVAFSLIPRLLEGFWVAVEQVIARRPLRRVSAPQVYYDPVSPPVTPAPRDPGPHDHRVPGTLAWQHGQEVQARQTNSSGRWYAQQALRGLNTPRNAPPVAEAPLPIFFKPGEPRTFAEFGLQEAITNMLDVQIQALPLNSCRMRPQMFLGPAGLGKTLLAKVCAEELRRRNALLGLPAPVFIEVFPADLPSVKDLDAVIRRAAQAPAAVLFIDEVHGLDGTHAHKLYELLENGRYPFHGESAPTLLPNVTLLAATTDYGKLHAALKRRWVKHYLEPASETQLHEILARRGQITSEAAQLIVSRTRFGGAPWEAIELLELARAHALARHRHEPQILPSDVWWVIEQQNIDTQGLRQIDRNVILALRDRVRILNGETLHGASESDTCVLAGLDKTEYRETVRPRLMARGLLEIRAGIGQVLTAKALTLYPSVDTG